MGTVVKFPIERTRRQPNVILLEEFDEMDELEQVAIEKCLLQERINELGEIETPKYVFPYPPI